LNDAIKALFREVFGTSDHLAAMFTYVIIITVISVIVIIWVGRLVENR